MPAYQDSSGRWRYRFTVRGARHSGSTPKGSNTKRVAEQLERIHAERVASRSFAGKVPTVKEFAARFLEHQAARTKPLTRRNQRQTVDNQIVPVLGRMRLDEVDAEAIAGMVTAWSRRGLAPNTINTKLGCFRRMLSLACEWGIIGKVPRVGTVKRPDVKPRYLSDDEARRLVEAAEPRWRSMIFVGLRTGLRVGELRGLHWEDVDLVRGVIIVRRTDPGSPKHGPTTPKGGKERQVPLTPDTADVLRAIRPPNATMWVWRGDRQAHRGGDALSEKGCVNAIGRIAKKAGVAHMGWHLLRHTYASQLVMRGVPLRVVQTYLGHSSIVQTERYAHLAPNFGHEGIAMLDTPLGQGATNGPAGLPDKTSDDDDFGA